jgi:DNA-directed RNA polymerase beta' subunit
VIDSKTLAQLQAHLAQHYPDQYKDILYKLNQVATEAQGSRGGISPSIRHMRESKMWRDRKEKLRQEIQAVYRSPNLTLQQKQDFVKAKLTELSPILTKEVFDAADAENNPFTWVVKSGMKGKPANINNLLGSPLQFTDPKGRIIPVPVLNGYARGLRPSEFWAASYGTRKGMTDTKLSVADSGYLSKHLTQIAHRSVVTDDDDPDSLNDESRGLPVDVSDDDNIGALLTLPQ